MESGLNPKAESALNPMSGTAHGRDVRGVTLYPQVRRVAPNQPDVRVPILPGQAGLVGRGPSGGPRRGPHWSRSGYSEGSGSSMS